MTLCQTWILQNKFCNTITNKIETKFLECSIILKQQQLRTCVPFGLKLPEVPFVIQNDGSVVPHIGIGTSKAKGPLCENAIRAAITYGYRSIDTAYTYGNEVDIGKAIQLKLKDGTVKREQLFVTTKLASIHHDCVEYACRLSLKNLCLDYVDLYLMNWPFGFEYYGDNILYPRNCNNKLAISSAHYVNTWHAMERLVDLCLVRSIGVSNFNSKQLLELLGSCRIKPVQNQIEVHPSFLNEKLQNVCKENNVVVTGHSPFAAVNPEAEPPKFLYHNWIIEIAKKYRKTPFQIILRYLIERGIIPIPKSTNHKHIIDNIDIFDFQLTPRDHHFLKTYNIGQRTVPFEAAKVTLHYPFNTLF